MTTKKMLCKAKELVLMTNLLHSAENWMLHVVLRLSEWSGKETGVTCGNMYFEHKLLMIFHIVTLVPLVFEHTLCRITLTIQLLFQYLWTYHLIILNIKHCFLNSKSSYVPSFLWNGLRKSGDGKVLKGSMMRKGGDKRSLVTMSSPLSTT